MIILSDCLTEKVDEGCLKVANSLTKRIKLKYPDTTVVSYDRKPIQSDLHLKLNKFLMNRQLFMLIRKKKEPVLYIPFSSNTKASAIRLWILSHVAKDGLKVIFVLRFPMDKLTKKILKLSGAEIVALSRQSYEFYKKEVGNTTLYLKTGIDASQFIPVSMQEKEVLRRKYNVASDKKVLLHVGHLKSGRNVDKLLNVGQDYHVFLVVSSVTENEKDIQLREKLNARPNTTIIDAYLEHIEELYQMSDVYLFPVQEKENCIDIPLSVLEAAACNIPVVTTDYGELKEFKNQNGFCFIDSLDEITLNESIDKMSAYKGCNNRESVLEYDWDVSIENLEI